MTFMTLGNKDNVLFCIIGSDLQNRFLIFAKFSRQELLLHSEGVSIGG